MFSDCTSPMGLHQNGSSWNPIIGVYGEVKCIVCTCLVCTSMCPLSPSVPAWSVPQCVRYHRLYLLGLYLTVPVIIVCTCLVCTLLCPLSSSVPAWSVLHCFPPLIFFNTFDSFLIFAQRIVCPFSVCDKICRQCAHFLITV